MKCFLFLGLLLTSTFAQSKTCTATLKGKLKQQQFSYPYTKVFHPREKPKSRLAKWNGNVVTKKFISPAPVEIECGKPFLNAKFDRFQATGMLPQSIETFPWSYVENGQERHVAPVTLEYYYGSYEYPSPVLYFNGVSDMIIQQPAPAGVSDICDLTTVAVGPVKELTMMTPQEGELYTAPFEDDYDEQYVWDPQGAPTNETVELELEGPEVIISCESQWKYKATFILDYGTTEQTRRCGEGSIRRTLELEGDFYLGEENKVYGFVYVEKPTTSYNGNMRGHYTGTRFTIPMEGKLVKTADGTQTVYLPELEGGDGIGFTFSLTCEILGTQTHTVYGQVNEMLRKMNEQEEWSSDEDFFKLNAEGDEKTWNVDWGSLGEIRIMRSWKKL